MESVKLVQNLAGDGISGLNALFLQICKFWPQRIISSNMQMPSHSASGLSPMMDFTNVILAKML